MAGFRKPVSKERWALGAIRVEKTTESLVLTGFTGHQSARWAKKERGSPTILKYKLCPQMGRRVTATVP